MLRRWVPFAGAILALSLMAAPALADPANAPAPPPELPSGLDPIHLEYLREERVLLQQIYGDILVAFAKRDAFCNPDYEAVLMCEDAEFDARSRVPGYELALTAFKAKLQLARNSPPYNPEHFRPL